jgi:NADH-quinone oxidoreductase subunit L
VPGLAGFFSKDEILFETFRNGHQLLWTIGVLTSLLTATYMFRLVFLTFHGEERFHAVVGAGVHGAQVQSGHGHAAPVPAAPMHQAGRHAHPAPTVGHFHLLDAPPAMALALIVLAIGSVLAGYVGIPHALGGHNSLGGWLEPAFAANNCGAPVTSGALAGIALENCAPGTEPALASMTQTASQVPDAVPAAVQPAEAAHEPAAAEAGHDETTLELTLMLVSSAIAVVGIGLAFFLWIKNRQIPEQMAQSLSGPYNLLLNKYYVDELYDATIVQPIKSVSTVGLWKGMDVRVVDAAVNGAGYVVGGLAAGLRLLQTGSVKTYAVGTLFGAVAILAFYLWR